MKKKKHYSPGTPMNNRLSKVGGKVSTGGHPGKSKKKGKSGPLPMKNGKLQ